LKIDGDTTKLALSHDGSAAGAARSANPERRFPWYRDWAM